MIKESIGKCMTRIGGIRIYVDINGGVIVDTT
jgi:hypothetical protein